MADLRLVIGDKNASPFSLEAWLTLKQLGLEFEEEVVRLRRPDTAELVRRHSPSGRLPLLHAGEIKVWDSLAINEFLADHFEQLWPAGAEARAVARSVAAEMHGGFTELRRFLPMDVTARFTPPGRLIAGVAAEVRRVVEIWHDCRGRFGQGGPFLFGAYTVADAMMAPVCTRFVTYALPLDELCQAYVEHVTGLPAMLEWAEGAAAEVAAAGPRPAMSARSPASAVADDDREDEPDLEPVAIEADEDDTEDADTASGPPAAGLPGVLPTRAHAERDGASWSAARAQARAPGREVRFEEAADDEEDDGRPPAPGLPATVATRPYAGEEDAAPSTYQQRRLVRPPGRSGLFSWRSPMPGTASPPLPPPPAVAPAPAPVLATPAARSQPPRPAAEPPRPNLPEPAPEETTPASMAPSPPRTSPAPRASPSDADPRPATAPPTTPRPAPSVDPPPAAAPSAAEVPPSPSPPPPRFTFRPETIKPIGTGIRRRR